VSYSFEPDPITNTGLAGIRRTALGIRFWRQVYAARTKIDLEYDSAECLYMIVQADPEARERFQSNEIGDADGDGMFEFHDGWGMPILFLRWAPGFVPKSELMTGDPEADPDPMNPRRIGELAQQDGKWIRPASIATFRLIPLIYSAGPNKLYGLSTVNANYLSQMAAGDPMAKTWLDGADLGRPYDPGHPEYDDHLDNITNHSLGMN
jgi:hypothetical protein